MRDAYWQQQRQREEEVLSGLDSALVQGLCPLPESSWSQVGALTSDLSQVMIEKMSETFHTFTMKGDIQVTVL